MSSTSLPIKIENFLTEDDFTQLKKLTLFLGKRKFMMDWDPLFERYSAHNISPLVQLLPKIETRLAGLFNLERLKFKFCFYSHYTTEGVCPPHVDKKECTWSLNLCLHQPFSWPLFIDGNAYDLKDNEAVFYKGSELKHWRNKNDSGKECDVCVFLFEEQE